MIGHQPLLRMRLDGQQPGGYVAIDLDRKMPTTKDWHWLHPSFPQIEVAKTDAIAGLDLRFVVDLYVVAFADEWSERFGELIDKIKRYGPKHFVAYTFDLEEPIVWPEATWPA